MTAIECKSIHNACIKEKWQVIGVAALVFSSFVCGIGLFAALIKHF